MNPYWETPVKTTTMGNEDAAPAQTTPAGLKAKRVTSKADIQDLEKTAVAWTVKLFGHPATVFFGSRPSLITRNKRDASYLLKGHSVPFEILAQFAQLDGQLILRPIMQPGSSSLARAAHAVLTQQVDDKCEIKFRVFDARPIDGRDGHDGLDFGSRIRTLRTAFMGHPFFEVATASVMDPGVDVFDTITRLVMPDVSRSADVHSIILRPVSAPYATPQLHKVRAPLGSKERSVDKARVRRVTVSPQLANVLNVEVVYDATGEQATVQLEQSAFTVDVYSLMCADAEVPQGRQWSYGVCVDRETRKIVNLASGWL